MGFDGYFYFGKITRTHGIKGYLILYCADDFILNLKKVKSLFFLQNNQLKEYPVLELTVTPPTCRFSVAGIDTMTLAETLLKQEVYLPTSVLNKSKSEAYTHELIGLTVMDKAKGNIGIIEDVLQFPQQKIAQINFNSTEILVPVNPHFIISIDSENKILNVDLPEGLVDVYLDKENKTQS